MPNIEDKGFIIHIKKFSEKSLIIKIFSENNGIVSAFLKDSFKKEEKYNNQIGNFVNFSLNYRDEEKYGNIKTEPIKNFLNVIFSNKLNLSIFNSSISIINNILVDNQDFKNIFIYFRNLIFSLNDKKEIIINNYVEFILKTLSCLGICINITKCAISGDNKNIFYISPKTGNCVCKNVGDKYKDKLFLIPEYLKNRKNINNKEDLKNCFKILFYFIHKYFLDNDIIYKYENIELFLKEVFKNI